jgi:hypothetical protein
MAKNTKKRIHLQRTKKNIRKKIKLHKKNMKREGFELTLHFFKNKTLLEKAKMLDPRTSSSHEERRIRTLVSIKLLRPKRSPFDHSGISSRKVRIEDANKDYSVTTFFLLRFSFSLIFILSSRSRRSRSSL